MASSTLLNVAGQQAQTNSDADAALAGLASAGSSSSSSRAEDITGTASLPQAATAGTTEPQAAVFSGPAAPAPPTYTYITPTAAGPNLSNNAAALSAPDQLTLQLPMGADSAPAAVTVAHRPDVWAPGVWVGELQVSPGPLSVVTLKMSAAGDVLTAAALAVAKANKAYVDSSVSVRLNLTAVRQVTYTEPPQAPGNSPSQILDDVTNGKIPEIQTLRNELSADLVLLFNNDSTTCGLSWGYNIQSDAYFNADHGYATIMSGCWYGHVLAHEVTHTLGCGHLWENEHICDGPKDSRFQDLMAANKCGSDNITSVHLVSNPAKTAFGVPAGDPSKAFCARAINETASAVARCSVRHVPGACICLTKPTTKPFTKPVTSA
ncbi:hypothetical protein OEZ86_013062 [Tetradesmus obliquus]|nr:hypothetical protein OEZ86_013062 [Tetradesmus obliquus]